MRKILFPIILACLFLTPAVLSSADEIQDAIVLMTSPDWPTANNARGSLRVKGDAAVPALADTLKRESCLEAATDVLKYIFPSEKSLLKFRAILKSDNTSERAGAALVLGFWKDIQSAQAIEALLEDKDVLVREYALSGYDNMIEAGLVNCSLPKVLSIVSTDKNSVATRVKAVRIIARIPGEETGNELLRLIQKETNPAILTEVLYQSGENATGEMIYPALEILVSDQDPEVKAAAVYLLRKLEANEAYPHILNLAKDGKLTNENLMLESFAALSKIGKKGDATHFLTYLNREVIGCPDCYNYKDTLLDLIENCSPPGNKESIAALEKFRLKASARMAEKVDKALSSLKRATQVN